MDMEKIYAELNSAVGLPGSKLLNRIWEILCTEEEILIASCLPGTAVEIAEKSGRSGAETEAALESLFLKGAAFKSVKNGKVRYRTARHIIQFHDASILWKGASQEFLDLWVRVMDEEFTAMIGSLPGDVKLPSFMRVIPVGESLDARSRVLPFEECARIINDAERRAVVECVCRKSQKNCDAPLEVCVQLNRGAEYAIERGTGREITREEALDILRMAEAHGLVHMQENTTRGNVICNCCSCCCEMFRLMKHTGKKWILSPSRFLAEVDSAACTGCGECIDICPVNALVPSDDESPDIQEADCIGCGLCASVCPVGAIFLRESRPEGHIPSA